MHVTILKGRTFKLLLLEKSDDPRIELKVVRLDRGSHKPRWKELGPCIAKSPKGVVTGSMMAS